LIHPLVRDLFLDLGKHPGFQDAVRRLHGGGTAALSGLTLTAKAVYSVLLWQVSNRPLILVVDGNKQAEALSEAVTTFFTMLAGAEHAGPQLLPALDVLPLQNLSPHAELCEQRAIGLWSLAAGRAPITVLPVGSALLRIEPASFYRQLALKLRTGEEVLLDEVVAHLESVGYERREPVEMVGEFSVRGGILDVFPPEAQKPVRIDLFGDQVESIRRFDVESQRSVLKVEEALLLPLTEYQRSQSLLAGLHELMIEADIPGRDLPPAGETFPGWELIAPMLRPRNASVLDLVERPLVVWDEPDQIQQAARRLWTRLEQLEPSPAYQPDRVFFRWEELQKQAASAPQLSLQQLDIGWSPVGEATSYHIATRPSLSFHGNMKVAVAEARNLVDDGRKVAFFASSTGEVERLADVLNEYAVPYQLGLEQNESTPA
jgi:transcription-repair coupling factor (superfamily II helicase)